MKALVYQGLRQMRWEVWPEVQPGPGEALVHICAVGSWRSIDLHMSQLVRKEINLHGTINYTRDEFGQANQWLVDRIFNPDLLITHTEPMSEGAIY